MSDTKLRELERTAAAGDPEALAAVAHARCLAKRCCGHAPQQQRQTFVMPKLPILWYENEVGDRWIPPADYTGDGEPEGYLYQHSRFPKQIAHDILRLTQRDEVEACGHHATTPTYGWTEGIEGRRCLGCLGTQTRRDGEPWPEGPDGWNVRGSQSVMRGNIGWEGGLVEALVRAGHPVGESILFAAVACERCANVAAWQIGLDDGYAPDSEEASKAGTTCEICES